MIQPAGQKEVPGLSMVFGLLLVFGLYFPTTASAHLTVFSVSAYLICLALLSVLIDHALFQLSGEMIWRPLLVPSLSSLRQQIRTVS